MSLLSWITGAPKVVENVFDMDKGLLTQVGRWAGGQQFTEQERAEFGQSLGVSVRGYAVATMGENTERSKTRREIAVMWFKMHIFFIRVTFLCIPIDHLAVKLAQQEGYELFGQMGSFTFDPWLCSITGGIGLFFWGTHSLRSSKWGTKE